MAESKYNGWTNYETWNVALWIDNEQNTHSERCSRAQEAWDRSEGEDDRLQAAKIDLADDLKTWIEDQAADLELGASMFSDLLSAAISEVNWYEIAENWLEDVDKEEAVAADEE